MQPRDIALVLLWMSGALLSVVAMALGARELSRLLSLFELLALRNEASLVLLGLAALLRPRLRTDFRLGQPGLQVLRNGAQYLSQYGWYYGIATLPLATVFALEFTAPLWVAILAVFVLRERLTLPRLGTVAIGLVGVLVILRPGYLPVAPATFVVLGVAVSMAVTTVVTKILIRTETTFSILFWMAAMQLPVNLILGDPLFWARLGPEQIPAALALGIGGLGSHLCLTQAFRHGDATFVMPLDFLRIPLIAAIGAALYGEPIDLWVMVGAALIVAGIVWSLRAESRAFRGRAAAEPRPG